MKNLFLTALSAISLGTFAQTSISLKNMKDQSPIAANSVIHVASQPDSTHKIEIDIKNNSNSTQTYDVIRYDMILNTQGSQTADAFFCYAGGCYTPMDNRSPNSLTLLAGESASSIHSDFQMLLAELKELSVKGFSFVKYTVINVNTAADSIQFSIKYNDPTLTGITRNQLKDLSFEIAPNPSHGNVNLKLSALRGSAANVQVYNSLGALVYEKQLTGITDKNHSISLDLEQLSAGVYFVNLRQADATATRKLVID